MRRRIVVLGVVAAVLAAGLVAVYLDRRGDDEATSAERATCHAVRDLEADLLDDNATTEDVTPRVAAVLRAANRTDNETLIIRARRTQRQWRDVPEADPDDRGEPYDEFLSIYVRLVDECEDLGVRIYENK